MARQVLTLVGAGQAPRRPASWRFLRRTQHGGGVEREGRASRWRRSGRDRLQGFQRLWWWERPGMAGCSRPPAQHAKVPKVAVDHLTRSKSPPSAPLYPGANSFAAQQNCSHPRMWDRGFESACSSGESTNHRFLGGGAASVVCHEPALLYARAAANDATCGERAKPAILPRARGGAPLG
jgi:hypothetical protein